MKRTARVLLFLVLAVSLSGTLPARAEYHRATRLGNPATRFAPPLRTPEDLRARFADPRLRPDFIEVLRQWGWTGKPDDLFAAAATAEIREAPIAVGDVLPFMSTRREGKPVCLRNVEWAGTAPAPAYAFEFVSNGQRYRCLTPKACSNFLLIDLGPAPRAGLSLACAVPETVVAGRPATVCLTVVNTGNVPEPGVVLEMPIPPGAAPTRITDGGAVNAGRVTWQLAALGPNRGKEVCVTLQAVQPADLAIEAVAKGASGAAAATACAAQVKGIPAILLEVVDDPDPIQVGEATTYTIRVTNQGSAPGTNIRLHATLAASQGFVSGSGETAVRATDSGLAFGALPRLEPKASATWQVVVRAAAADDARFNVELTSDQFARPIVEMESTQQY